MPLGWIESPTLEGLIVTETPASDGWVIVREFLRPGVLVHEYRYREEDDFMLSRDEDVGVLLKHVSALVEQAAALSNATRDSLETARTRRDAKVAKRRLRRWIDKNDQWMIRIPREYHDLVNRVLREAPEPSIDYKGLLDKALDGDGVGILIEYERRKLERPVILVDSIPTTLAAVLEETTEAYCYGLFRASVALCRGALEEVINLALDSYSGSAPVSPYDRRNLESSINSVPADLLALNGKRLAQEIRKVGNDVLHEGYEPSEDEAQRLLVYTARIAAALANKGGFDRRR